MAAEQPAGDPAAVGDGSAAQYDYASYYAQQQAWAAQAQAQGDANWQYWQAAGVQVGPNGATPATTGYYYPGYAYNTTNGQAAAQNYAAYYPAYQQQQQYGYTAQPGYDYSAATQYAQQYANSTQQQQPPPPSHPPPAQPPPPNYPPPPVQSPTAKPPAAPSWAAVAEPAYTAVKFNISKQAPTQRLPAQPLQHIINQQQQAKQQQKVQQQPQQQKTQQPKQPQQQQQNTTDNSDKGNNPKGSWPAQLRVYVERTFEKCSAESERAELEAELKNVITQASQDGTLWSRDWDNEPLVSLKKDNKFNKKNKRKNDFTIAPEDEERKQRRQKRFLSTTQNRNNTSSASAPTEFSEMDKWDEMTVKGYCQDLEKQYPPKLLTEFRVTSRYLRLTSAPDPSTVRPEAVLKKTIKMLREKWQKTEDYDYICEQLKSVRQDLTVQRIKNGFTVGVYEMHARLALENDDLGEFNQCQSQLKELYREGISTVHAAEFTAYRILYFLHVSGDVASSLSSMSPAMRKEPAVVHAMKVMLALATNNYHQFFKLYADTPNMGTYLMDKLMKRMRTFAIKCIIKSYRPTVELDFVQKELGFTKPQDCRTFLRELGVSIVSGKEGVVIDTKNSQACLDVVI